MTVLTPDTCKLFVNGELKATTALDATQSINLPDILYIGCKDSNFHNPWRGQIGEVAFWNEALNPNRIKRIYKQAVENNTKLWDLTPETPTLRTID